MALGPDAPHPGLPSKGLVPVTHWLLVLAEGDPSPLAQVDDAQDWIVIALTMLFFVIFLNLMRTLVFQPVLALLEERKRRITQGFTDIEQERAALATLKGRYEEQLTALEADAHARTQTVVSEGKKQAQGVTDKARADYLEHLEQGKHDIELELSTAKSEVRTQVEKLVFSTVERALGQSVDQKRHAATVRAAVEEAIH